ncbi:MAG: hypothetical protein JXR10_02650 [Cyclobacteriaceae bacterium]
MTLLRVHDQQQELTNAFVQLAKKTIRKGNFSSHKEQEIYLQGQEMGFCNDEIRVLLEEVITK